MFEEEKDSKNTLLQKNDDNLERNREMSKKLSEFANSYNNNNNNNHDNNNNNNNNNVITIDDDDIPAIVDNSLNNLVNLRKRKVT
jgi:hypothetical protein